MGCDVCTSKGFMCIEGEEFGEAKIQKLPLKFHNNFLNFLLLHHFSDRRLLCKCIVSKSSRVSASVCHNRKDHSASISCINPRYFLHRVHWDLRCCLQGCLARRTRSLTRAVQSRMWISHSRYRSDEGRCIIFSI